MTEECIFRFIVLLKSFLMRINLVKVSESFLMRVNLNIMLRAHSVVVSDLRSKPTVPGSNLAANYLQR